MKNGDWGISSSGDILKGNLPNEKKNMTKM